VSRHDQLHRWDEEIITRYLDRVAGRGPVDLADCRLTFEPAYARALDAVLVDAARRSSREPEPPGGRWDSGVLRDAAISVAMERYLATLGGERRRSGKGDFGDRVVEGLIVRLAPCSHAGLRRVSAAVPGVVHDELEGEIDRVIGGFAWRDELASWHGDLAADLKSSITEAVIIEWMRRRAEAFLGGGIPMQS
jgi:hypothetical protein